MWQTFNYLTGNGISKMIAYHEIAKKCGYHIRSVSRIITRFERYPQKNYLSTEG